MEDYPVRAPSLSDTFETRSLNNHSPNNRRTQGPIFFIAGSNDSDASLSSVSTWSLNENSPNTPEQLNSVPTPRLFPLGMHKKWPSSRALLGIFKLKLDPGSTASSTRDARIFPSDSTPLLASYDTTVLNHHPNSGSESESDSLSIPPTPSLTSRVSTIATTASRSWKYSRIQGSTLSRSESSDTGTDGRGHRGSLKPFTSTRDSVRSVLAKVNRKFSKTAHSKPENEPFDAPTHVKIRRSSTFASLASLKWARPSRIPCEPAF